MMRLFIFSAKLLTARSAVCQFLFYCCRVQGTSLDYAKKLVGDFEFSVCVAGRAQFFMCTQSLLLGGNVRVGLKDNLYLDKGTMAKSNAEHVNKIARIAKEFGIEPASPDEARKILNLKGIDKVNF
jgi:3,5-dioxohexanoate:acetyl-CoA acetone transferase